MYAASKEIFHERIKEELDIEVLKAPLTRENYKKKFHNMICWEEKKHIEILDEKCSGVYRLVFYAAELEPAWIQSRDIEAQPYARYGKIEGIIPDKIAYATQASEAVYILVSPGEAEVKADILRANYNHTDENMYIGFRKNSIQQLRMVFPDLSSEHVTYNQVKIEFEVKHMFFNDLIKSVNSIDPVIVQRLLPRSHDFLMKSSDYFQYKHHMHAVISQLDPGDQLNALKTIVLCRAQSPPILINGSFGSGKTRVLAIATYYITEMALKETVRVLICAHHQKSADNLIESYFGDMMENRNFPWQTRLIRLVSSAYKIRGQKFSEVYRKLPEIREEVINGRISTTTGNLVIATTCSTALRLKYLFAPGFFTHILIDEGAQSREPEAIAPLSLASSGTKIIIAGDSYQVGPALLVLGDETRDNGFKLSLLERLQMEYEKIGESAKEYLLTLSTNYRCHKSILAIPNQLFYSGLTSKAQKADPHPKASYPLLFICSNLTSDVCSPDVEASVLLEQVNFFVQHWPSNNRSWGNYDLKKIAIVTSTYPQLVVTRNIGKRKHKDLHYIRLIPIYLIQGQEFPAVFLSTTEPIDQDGNTLNPTKSPCDRYVFNTVLTRAKSLVVVVGSPRVLLNTEQHMIKLYGDKGRCWSLYLKSCLEHGTLRIPQYVEPDQSIAQRFKEELAAHLGATLPNDHIMQSSRLNYRTCPSVHVASSSGLLTHSTQSSGSHHVAIRSKSGLSLVHRPLSSNENILKQMSQVEDIAPINLHPTTSTYSHPAVQRSQKGSFQKSRIIDSANQPFNRKSAEVQESRINSAGSTTLSNEQTVRTNLSQPLKLESSTQLSESLLWQANPKTKSENRGDQVSDMLRNPGVASPRTLISTTATKAANRTPPQQKRNNPRNTDAARHQESSNERVTVMPTPVSAPVHAKSRKAKKKANVSSDHPTPSPSLLADFWPTLNEAAKTKTKKKVVSKPPSEHAPLVIPEAHSESFSQYKNQLHIECLKEPLTQENYVQKFHHLLCWEEQEHDKILKQRCTGLYEVSVFQPNFKPNNVEYTGDEELVRYGYISSNDGDRLSYAKQASEGSFIVLDQYTFIKSEHVFAHIPKSANSNAIIFGLTNDENTKLLQWNSLAKKQWSHQCIVHFELKHSYFQRLHTALDKLQSDAIKMILPSHENFDTRKWYLDKGKPIPDALKLDSCQERALYTIMRSTPGAPVLVTGPFGTGKTRILARAAYEILKLGEKTRVLICAHHQASVDTFVEILANIIDKNEMIRIIPNKSYRSQTREKYSYLFATKSQSQRLIITTLGILRISYYPRFSHILIDEGAQTREPEIIGPLRFASSWTKLIIAGDHLQVGPQLLVLGKEAQEHGLATSLLERLHNHYIELGEVAEKHLANLLTNYRCQSGILMLPSSLFYGSTLQCRTRNKPHPLATYPLHFVCTSLKLDKSNSHSENALEATTLLNQVQKFVERWPEKQWGPKNLAKVCIMSPSPDQVALIRETMYHNYKQLRGIEILKAYEIQGREFRAIFIGTSEITYIKDESGHVEGEPQNLTKSVSDRYVFNTAITRSQYLVVAVGNPFLLMHIEKCMKRIYGEKAINCWSRFMRQCLECNTFHFTNQAKMEFDNERFISLRDLLYKDLFPTKSAESIRVTDFDTYAGETVSDSILDAYKRELERIPDCQQAKLTLSRVEECDLAWIMSETSDQKIPTTHADIDDKEDVEYEDTYECVLECHSYRKAEAIPMDKQKKIVIIRGSGNRIPAFNGDTVMVGVFRNNPEDKCYGRVLEVRNRGHEPRFLCRVSHRNPVIFYPVDEMNPLFCNLPRISRALLYRRDKGAVEVELESRKDVVVFRSSSIGVNIKEGKVPPIQQIIPLSVAKDMLFIVAFIQWKKNYRTPLGIVIGAIPKGFTAFSAERLLKMKHGIEYDDDDNINEMSADAECEPDSGTLYDYHVFIIDPDGAQNLDDAVSLVELDSQSNGGLVKTYQLGVHIVNCAKHIEQDSSDDKEARRKGISVYGGREGKIMQMLPVETRKKLSLKPNRIRDVISVIGVVVIGPDGIIDIKESTIKIEQAQIISSIQLTYMTAQKVMDGDEVPELNLDIHRFNSISNQPSLSETLQFLFKVSLYLRRNRLQSDAAYAYDLNDPEDSYCWQAHMLIEELMIWANSAVASRIHSAYPNAALLRRQPEPNQEMFTNFIDDHKNVTNLSLALSSLTNGVCKEDDSDDTSFILASSTLKQIREAISTKNLVRLTSLIASDRYHPQIAAVLSKLRSLFPKAEYCCTDEGEEDSLYRHYSLKLDNYTHFSSPLRRYLDIQVQRMLVHLPQVSKDFDHYKHEKLCIQLNSRARNANQFERSLKNVDLAITFGSSSEVYEAYIADNVKGAIEIWFPQLELKDVPKKERKLPLKFLGPFANVKEEELLTRDGQTFHWKFQMTSFNDEQGKFVCNVPGLSIEDEESANKIMDINMLTGNDSNPLNCTLSANKYMASRRTPLLMPVALNDWKKALTFVKDPGVAKMKELEAIFPKPPTINSLQTLKIDERLYSPFITVYHQANFNPHSIIRVWMTQSMKEAHIIPAVQLVEVSPLVRICVQHNTHPAECFSDLNLSYASRKFYMDITEYVQIWEKVVLAEAAETSVRDSKQVIIHDVTLEWPRLTIPSNCIDEDYYQPTNSIILTLPKKFVENCAEFIVFNTGDLVCARYGTDPHADTRAVFHMVIHKIQYKEEDEIELAKVWMKFIGDRSCRISERMKAVLKTRCELQLISLSTTFQRIYQGLLKLLNANNLVKEQATSTTKKSGKAREISRLVTHIALGNLEEVKIHVPKESELATREVFKEHLLARQMWTKSHIYLNRVQEKAANFTFTNPFQLIQGPPGTGKSETGAHIAYTFAMANKRLSPSKSVLYCGPSNKSVDVILEKLHELCISYPNVDLKILRIYGRAVETKYFPGPDHRGKPKSEYVCPSFAEDYALHYKIRKGQFGSKLVEFEKNIKALPNDSLPDGKTCREYRKTLLQAEESILSEHYDIVLCTCSESSSSRVRKCVFPRQCIVDECGMANEPECITPLQLCEHIVLIGDHKQLQPVISSKTAADHGLSTSLFQRYAERFEGQYIERLTIQYRMHEAICEFPSEHFYDRNLETADSVKKRNNPETKLDSFWPKHSECPILFCHIIGKEDDHKTGRKAAGGKKIGIDSKYNETEATKVIEIATNLHKVRKVGVKQIAILTPYSAQKNLINKKMKEAKLEIKVASITESQGDEYGIVILSTVRSLPEKEIANPDHVQADHGWLYEHLGFLTDPHQLNVGITRSKYGLIIVGNKLLLRYDKHWEALIEHYEEKECVVDGHKFCTR